MTTGVGAYETLNEAVPNGVLDLEIITSTTATTPVVIAPGISLVNAETYNGAIPGPTLHLTQGETAMRTCLSTGFCPAMAPTAPPTRPCGSFLPTRHCAPRRPSPPTYQVSDVWGRNSTMQAEFGALVRRPVHSPGTPGDLCFNATSPDNPHHEGAPGAVFNEGEIPNIQCSVADAQTKDELYVTFANSWRVTRATSLFTYEPGTSAEFFADPNWPAQEPPCTAKPGLELPLQTGPAADKRRGRCGNLRDRGRSCVAEGLCLRCRHDQR